jgi:hypothetical protein
LPASGVASLSEPNACASAEAAESSELPVGRLPNSASIDPPGRSGETLAGEDDPFRLVADPDRLLTEETILDGVRERGFDLIPFEDHVAFRYAYETRYRQAWDRGEQTNLVVLLHTLHADTTKLPFDALLRSVSLPAVLAEVL